MKLFYSILLLLFSSITHAQKIDSIFVNLYTDSLKVGTYNYINIVGINNHGDYVPLDSSQLNFNSSEGKFYGNNLFLEANKKIEKVKINVSLKSDPKMFCSFIIYIKKHEDTTPLPLESDIINQRKTKKS